MPFRSGNEIAENELVYRNRMSTPNPPSSQQLGAPRDAELVGGVRHNAGERPVEDDDGYRWITWRAARWQ